MYQDEINRLAKEIIAIGPKNKVVISTAESCTGGMIGAAITSISGSSTVYDRGFITYSNNSKAELLGIDINLINQHGAVSKEIAKLMAEGCLIKSNSNLSVSVTGVAGPGGGNNPNTPIPMGAFTQDYEYVEGLGDLDECNGRFGVTPEFPEGIYYYVVTDDFPFFTRCLKGDV